MISLQFKCFSIFLLLASLNCLWYRNIVSCRHSSDFSEELTRDSNLNLINKSIQPLNFVEKLNFWACDDTETLLGLAKNRVVNHEDGKGLCEFLNRKRREFDIEFSLWKKDFEYDKSTIKWYNIIKLIKLKFMSFPKFWIQANVTHWDILATSADNVASPYAVVEFSYVLPLSKSNCYGRFENMTEKFIFNRKKNPRPHTIVLLAPVVPKKLEYMKETIKSDPSLIDMLNSYIRLKRLDKFSARFLFERFITHKPYITTWHDDLFFYRNTCRFYDGRFYQYEMSMTQTNLCYWITTLRDSSLKYHFSKQMIVINIEKAAIFTEKDIKVCGIFTSNAFTYSGRLCFYLDNYAPSHFNLPEHKKVMSKFISVVSLSSSIDNLLTAIYRLRNNTEVFNQTST